MQIDTAVSSPSNQKSSYVDEPASALDPIATLRIEELIQELKQKYTIFIVTHNMQQAVPASDFTAFFNMGEDRAGYLVEFGETETLFTNPQHELTEQYIIGRFGQGEQYVKGYI